MEPGVTRLTKGPDTYAIFVHGRVPVNGANFVTDSTDEFQVGLLERAAGYAVKPHMHPPRDHEIHRMTEFLFVQEGKIRVAVFDEEWKELGMAELSAGDFLVFLRGGHSVQMLEPTRLIEVKQGPYPGDAAAKAFPSQS